MIGIRADGNNQIGMGHIMRCFAVAGELSKLGEEYIYIVSPDTDTDALDKMGLNYHALTKSGDNGWDVEEVISYLQIADIKTLLIDSYRITEDEMARLSQAAKTYYIDDYYNFSMPANAIINFDPSSHHRDSIIKDVKNTASKYPIETEYLLGPSYFPLRAEFSNYDTISIQDKVKNVLITSASSDSYEICAKILEFINVKEYPDVVFNVLVGKYFNKEYKTKLEALANDNSNIKLLPWGQNMAHLYTQMDLVIAPGSTSIFEALSMGVPSICYEFVDNQSGKCQSLAESGLAPFIGSFVNCNDDKLTSLSHNTKQFFKRMLDTSERLKYAHLSQKTFDKKGAYRIAQTIL